LRIFLGGDDVMHTLVFEGEWGSLDTMASASDKIFVDPEWQKQMAKWETAIE